MPVAPVAGTQVNQGSNASTGGSISLPAGLVAGDLMELGIICSGTRTISSGLSGWTLLRSELSGDGSSVAHARMAIYRRTYVGGDTAPSVTFSGGTRWCAVIIGYPNQNGESFDADALTTVVPTTSTSGVAPAVNPAENHIVRVAWWAMGIGGTSATVTMPSPFATNTLCNAGNGSNHLAVGWEEVTGNPGTATCTSTQASRWVINSTTVPIPAVVTIVPSIGTVTASKISRVSGKDSTDVEFSSNEAFTEYQFRIVSSSSDPVASGTQVEIASLAGSASTTYTATLTDDELVAASAAEGSNLLKVFLKDVNGEWSP